MMSALLPFSGQHVGHPTPACLMPRSTASCFSVGTVSDCRSAISTHDPVRCHQVAQVATTHHLTARFAPTTLLLAAFEAHV
jgi:hypothetical protein